MVETRRSSSLPNVSVLLLHLLNCVFIVSTLYQALRRTGGVFLSEPVMEIYPEADTQN
ncbi:hypothetical protein F2Q70_00000170 [Brassica cretica]|uniref:Uncharacterized protein n=1 Tax=Brassica cretica TaxID=69181 RepID=A0A8S9J3C5_BRACR|nr:hypothetical protein F2Q70_00000170 [Brassica cretica]